MKLQVTVIRRAAGYYWRFRLFFDDGVGFPEYESPAL